MGLIGPLSAEAAELLVVYKLKTMVSLAGAVIHVRYLKSPKANLRLLDSSEPKITKSNSERTELLNRLEQTKESKLKRQTKTRERSTHDIPIYLFKAGHVLGRCQVGGEGGRWSSGRVMPRTSFDTLTFFSTQSSDHVTIHEPLALNGGLSVDLFMSSLSRLNLLESPCLLDRRLCTKTQCKSSK